MLEIILVRHGESIADVEDRYEGQADFPLSAFGCEQANKLADWIHLNFPTDTIISSPLKRAAQTAEIIGRKNHAEVLYDNNLKELGKGIIDGLLKTEADEKYPKPINGHAWNSPIYGGESLQSFTRRVQGFWVNQIESITDLREDHRIVIVTHGGVINTLFACFMSLPLQSEQSLHTAHVGVHCWRLNRSDKSIVFSNLTEHLK